MGGHGGGGMGWTWGGGGDDSAIELRGREAGIGSTGLLAAHRGVNAGKILVLV